MDIQTRRRGQLVFYSSIAEAHSAWVSNSDIEKISWTDSSGIRQMWIPHTKGTLHQDFENHLCSLNINYRDTGNNSKWWYLNTEEGVVSRVIPDASFVHQFCR